jgi:hypothetical protein
MKRSGADNFLDRKYHGAYTSLLEKCLCRLSHPMKFYAKILHRKIFPPSPWSLINSVPNSLDKRHAVEFYEKYFLPVIVDQFSTKSPWQKACRGILWKNISWKNISFPWSLIKIFRRKICPSRDRWSILYRNPFTRGMPWNSTKKYFVEKYFLPLIVDQFSTKSPWQKACRAILWKNIWWKNISFPWSLIKTFRRKIFPSRDRWSILYRIPFTRGLPWNFTKKYFIEKLFLPMLLLMKFYEKIFEKRLLPVFVVLLRSNRKVKEVSDTIDDAPFNI